MGWLCLKQLSNWAWWQLPFSGWQTPAPSNGTGQGEIPGSWGWEGVASMVWGIRSPPSKDGDCLGTCREYQGSLSFSCSFYFFLPQCASCQAPERSVLSCLPLSSPHLPMGRCQSLSWPELVPATGSVAWRWSGCLPQLLGSVGVSLRRTPVPACSTPPCAEPPLSFHGHGSPGRRHSCPAP